MVAPVADEHAATEAGGETLRNHTPGEAGSNNKVIVT
jgi:hypothetical protein